MGRYFQINDKCFKFTVRTLVGRGEPFSVFNEDREVARSHLLVVEKNNKTYIKDLGSKSGTFLNGKKIKKDKWFEFKEEDSLVIGRTPIKMLATAPDEFIEIKAIQTNFNNYLKRMTIAIPAFIFTLFLFFTYKSWTAGASESFVIALLIASFLFGIMTYIQTKIMFFIMRKVMPTMVSEMYFSSEGITLHYEDNSNMTFKFDSLESWDLEKSKVVILKTEARVEKIFLQDKKQIDKLVDFLNTTVPQKRLKTLVSPVSKIVGVMIVAGFLLMIACHGQDVKPEVADIGFWTISSFCIMALLSQKIRHYWPIQVTTSFTAKRQISSIVLTIFSAYFLRLEYKDIHHNVAMYEKCIKEDSNICKQVDFDILLGLIKIESKTLSQACEQGNNSACERIRFRQIAGKKDK